MNTKAKLLASILSNPKQVRFADACKAAELLGFVHTGGRGSHRTFIREDEPLMLNFQNRDGFVVPYQAKQLAAMIEKYSGNV
jgi:predicted RNA binding protein YcfA (HicA-like mRNA interferase family)